MLDDHLGSTHVIADANGKQEQTMSFDVFGARRDAKTWARDFSDQTKFTSKITLRGYTGHEQMDEVGLIHMGGRIYDPILGRFLQADPMVQAPENIQNLNRYSYVVNNPLNKTDPSGYIFLTIAVWALNALATTTLTATATGAAISAMLTAYEYYGWAKLAVNVIEAGSNGGTALANFVGGFAKSFAKGKAITCLLNMAAGGGCIDGFAANKEQTKTQGSTQTDAGNETTAKSSSNDTNDIPGFNGTETSQKRAKTETITVLIEEPDPDSASKLGRKGMSGHAGAAVGEDFYDYGPQPGEGTNFFGSKGRSWWDSFASSSDDASLTEINSYISEKGKKVSSFTMEVTVEQAVAFRSYWDDLYANPGTYHFAGRQCTTTVAYSLRHAGLGNYNAWKPTTLANQLRNSGWTEN
jgi:RHS repeat-associated protein